MGKVKGQRTIQVDTAGRPGGPPAGGDRKAPLPWEATSKKCGVGGPYTCRMSLSLHI